MNPLTFNCSNCQQPIGVAPEYAGMPVSCPHCRQVITAPAKPAPVATPKMDSNIHGRLPSVERSTANLRASTKQAKEREDSIFSDPEEEGDDEALFGLDPAKKRASVQMPDDLPTVSPRNTPHDLTQPTQRVPGLAPTPAAPRQPSPSGSVRKLPVPPPDSKAFPTSLNAYPPPDAANPFEMEAALPTEFSQPEAMLGAKTVGRRRKEPEAAAAAAATPNWKLWIIIGLAVYSFFITIVAIWGWMRSTQAPPVKSDTPATQKAKPR